MHPHLQQGSREWLELRRTKIGASDAPIIMGVSPWMTAYQLWEYKVGLRAPQEETDSMRRGRSMEDVARRRFEEEMGIIVFPAVLFHRDHDWMMASLDGIDIEHKTIVEIKCPGKKDQEEAMEGRVPKKYYPQLQHQMAVCGVDNVIYYSYAEDSTTAILVKRNEEYIDKLIYMEYQFWNRVVTLEAPDITEKDYTIIESDEWKSAAEAWKIANAALKVAQKEEEDLRRYLISMSKDCNAKGAGITLSRSMRKGNVNYKSIPVLNDIDLELYRNPPSVVFRIYSQYNDE